MTTYKIFWEIDIEADTPEDAAREARKMQLDPQAQVGHFTVSYTKELPVEVEVDLDAPATVEAVLDKPEVQDVVTLKGMTVKELEGAYALEVPGYPRIKWWATQTHLLYHQWVHAQINQS